MNPIPKKISNIPKKLCKKHLGQNFLSDPNILKKIISSSNITQSDNILEIGPGLGSLTQHLILASKHTTVIEKDKQLHKVLTSTLPTKNITIINADFLKYPVESLPKELKVVSNIPYNISTPIIEKLITCPDTFTDIFLTIQYELAQRLAAKVNTKTYSAFSCYVQYHTKPSLLFKIKRTSFYPVPKVDSCFVRLQPRKNATQETENKKTLFTIIRTAFQQRRKTLPNALAQLIEKETLLDILDNCTIDKKARAENVSLQQYITLAKAFEKTKNPKSV